MNIFLKVFFIAASSLFTVAAVGQNGKFTVKTIIVVFDGLRPDYITPDAMPNLYAFKQKGAYGNANHSVFPTVTRVNAASYSTGSYPGTHGLMANTVYFPEVYKNHGVNTGDAKEMQKVMQAIPGKLLTAPSLGEILQANGDRMVVYSSGSTGQAFMQNYTVSGGAIINPGLVLPETLKDSVYKAIGPVGAGGKHQWVTDALIHYSLAPGGPAVSALWYGDPDGNAHDKGIGAPETMAAIKTVDAQFGRIVQELESKGLAQYYNIIVTADHGFITYDSRKTIDLEKILVSSGLKQSAGSNDVVVIDQAIYVKNHDTAVIRKIVQLLLPLEAVGAIFTRTAMPGTLPFSSIHWNHARAGDILVDANWDDRKNSAGYAGTAYEAGEAAGHGNSSPYTIHIPLIASGPSFKARFTSELPTCNVDIAPTVLYTLGIAVPHAMDGRVMSELLVKPVPGAPGKLQTETIKAGADYTGGHYQLELHRSVIGRYQYVDFTKVVRSNQ